MCGGMRCGAREGKRARLSMALDLAPVVGMLVIGLAC